MKKKELYEMDFDTAVEELREENNDITDYDTLKQFAIEELEDDNVGLALHILNAIYNSNNTTDYFSYDFSMGTLESPTGLETLEDLEDFCED